MGFDVDGPLSAGSGGYCSTSAAKSDPGIMLTSGSGSGVWGIEALPVRQTRKLGKTLGDGDGGEAFEIAGGMRYLCL